MKHGVRQLPCQYVVGHVSGDMVVCGKPTSLRSSERLWWRRVAICYSHLQFSLLEPKDWL